MTTEEMKVLDWDDEILDDGEERSFVTLEEGEYFFEVTKFEKELFSAKAESKIPDCKMAIITLKIPTQEGDAYIKDKFYLVGSCEWRISSFFRSIGLKKHGEPLRMKWTEAVGLKGKAYVTKDPGNKDNVFFNNIKYYIDPVAKPIGEKDGSDVWN